jgi:hypothetical protein
MGGRAQGCAVLPFFKAQHFLSEQRSLASDMRPLGTTLQCTYYWAIRLFCSTFTRLSVQKVQLEP